MSTNTTDPYAPALSRHIFTDGSCSNGSQNQPQFNESNGAFTETWDGYIYVPETMDNVKLKVSADDNACFYLYAFPDNKVNLPGRGPLGGGSYASAESTPIAHPDKGYYRVNVTYENINHSGANVARLDVLLNGTQITIDQPETHNLLSSQKAFELCDFYTPVSYPEMSKCEVYAMFDKTDINEDSTDNTGDGSTEGEDTSGDNEGDTSGDKERLTLFAETETATVFEVQGTDNSCATRLSIALSRSGFPVKNGPGANNVHILKSDIENKSGMRVKWHNACLRPDGIHNETDTQNDSHFISSADNLSACLVGILGNPDYSSLSQYKKEYAMGNFSPDDIIIFHNPNPYTTERRYGHIGLGHSPDYTEGDIDNDYDITNIWIVHRATWEQDNNE